MNEEQNRGIAAFENNGSMIHACGWIDDSTKSYILDYMKHHRLSVVYYDRQVIHGGYGVTSIRETWIFKDHYSSPFGGDDYIPLEGNVVLVIEKWDCGSPLHYMTLACSEDMQLYQGQFEIPGFEIQ